MLGRKNDSLHEMPNDTVYIKKIYKVLFYVPSNMEKQVLFKYHNEYGHLGPAKISSCRSLWSFKVFSSHFNMY